MSQAGIIDFIGTHPQIPTIFVANVGTAIPIANTIELLGAVVAAHGVPLQTVASGNTVDFNIQYASAAASSIAGNAGVASFSSTQFTVDANGFVTVTGGSFAEFFQVDAFTAPGTNPVAPTGGGIITVTGGQVAAGTTANVIRTDSLAANTYTIQIQRSQAVAVSTVGDNGVSHFDSAAFDVDANGFVQLNGGGIAATAFEVQANTAPGTNPVVPTAAGLVNVNGAAVANHSVVLETRSRAANTYNLEIQYSTSAAATDATKSGVSHFNSTYFTVDANGFVSLNGSGVGETITGNIGGALSPTAGNWNILGASTAPGSTPVQTSGSVSTLTVQVQKSQAIAATDATKVGLAAFDSAKFSVDANGFVTASGTGIGQTITGNSGGALSPTAGNWNILGTGSMTSVGSGSTLTMQLTGLTNHNILIGAGTATITNVAPSATSGVPLISNGASADPSFGTAVVAGGGTGDTSFTAYAVICGGTTSTGPLQSIASVGTANQVLTSNGAGALPTFQTISATGAFDQIVVQVFTTPGAGTYTPTTGMKYCTIEVIGGGGGGAGAAGASNTNNDEAHPGGGGGGGGYSRKTVTAATIGASKALNVGAGGNGGSAGANPGSTGGTTSVGATILQATGGVGGSIDSNSGFVAAAPGGAGGVGSLGDINSNGGAGGAGINIFNGTSASVQGVACISGQGGDCQLGAGGLALTLVGGVSSTAGNNGTAYGGGGGGAASAFQDTTAKAGGNGADGVVIITEYISV